MQLASAPRESSGQNERSSMAVQAAPAPAGDPLLVSRFLPTRESGNYRITLYRTTSAKTRATATLRQLHIPPNVRVNSGLHNIQWVKCSNHNKGGGKHLLSLRRVSLRAVT